MNKTISKYNGLTFNYSITRKFSRRENNNCYTYAINQLNNPYTNKPYRDYDYCQPGYLGGKGTESWRDYEDIEITSKEILNSVRRDLKRLGYKLLKTTYEKYIADNDCWKVAFCMADDDYHWYRQNDDGTWSHKVGPYGGTNKDRSRKVIHNPKECNRGKYTTFVGFYLIKRIKGVENKCS